MIIDTTVEHQPNIPGAGVLHDPVYIAIKRLMAAPPRGVPAADLTSQQRIALAIAAGAPYESSIEGCIISLRTKVPVGISDRGDGGYFVAIGQASSMTTEPTTIKANLDSQPVLADGTTAESWEEREDRLRREWSLGDYENGETGCPNCGRCRLCLCPNGKHRCEKCDWSPELGDYVPSCASSYS